MSFAAVITADIVNSTKIAKADYKKLMKNLTSILQEHQHEFFRGDSFQVLVKSPNEALQVLLQTRTAAMKLIESSMPIADIRASVGIGNVKLPVKSFQTASGDVFILSGRSFDKMEKNERLIIVCDEKNKAVNSGLKVLSQFIDYLFQRLTFKQAAVVYELLMNRTQIDTAKRLKKSQATVHKHTQAAGWPEIEKLLMEYKTLVTLIEP
ncbi:MAG TPA: hypothetical protein VNT20_09450 [Flavisolibacter sp.]|jgi:hypothetical protein|nr:hypothetical protein [Flavisolibacter sp.]